MSCLHTDRFTIIPSYFVLADYGVQSSLKPKLIESLLMRDLLAERSQLVNATIEINRTYIWKYVRLRIELKRKKTYSNKLDN